MKPVLQLKNVTKTYTMGDSLVHALQDISLDINQGEFLAILGPSGSGKSTLMNLIGCLDLATKGTILLNGENIETMSESRLAQLRGRGIGFVFQGFHLIPTLTALENVALPLEFQDVSAAQARKKAAELLKVVGLQDRLHHLPTQLSGGQMQRVAIARALANDPAILLADEPTGNLDSRTGDFIISLFDRIHAEGKTIILVTHDVSLARRARRIVHIKDGRIERIERRAAA